MTPDAQDHNANALPNPLVIKLSRESVTGKCVQGTKVTGAVWTLDPGVLTLCTLPPESFELGLDSVKSF